MISFSRILKKVFPVLILLSVAVFSFSIDFTLNGNPWKSFSTDELRRLSYPVPAEFGRGRGISADELFPPVYDAWKISLSAENGIVEKRIPELASLLPGIYLVESLNGWTLSAPGWTVENVKTVDITGEKLHKSELEIWINWEGGDLLKEELRRYEVLHEVSVKTLSVPRPDSKLIAVSAGGGQVPDLIMVQSGYIESLSRSGSIQNLDYMYPAGLMDEGRAAFSLDGKTWAVPFYYDAQMMFINPELMQPPRNSWTTADFEAAAEKLESRGIVPSSWNAYSSSFLIPFQISFGKESLIETDGSLIINDEPNIKALEYVLSLQDRGLMKPMEKDAMISMFVSGDVAMIISASYSIPYFEKLGIPFDAVPLPVNSETGIRLAGLLDFKAFAVPKKSMNTLAAIRLIEYLCGTGVQQRFTSAVSKLPASEEALRLIAGSNRYIEQLTIGSDSGIVIPPEQALGIYKNTMWKMLRFALSGRMSPEAVLEQTQKIINNNLQ